MGGLWVRLGKIKCAAIWVGLCGCIAALLILRRVGILSTVFLLVYVTSVGRPTLAPNVPRAGDRNPVLRLRQGYGACTLLQAGVLSLSVDSFMLLILKLL